VEASVHALHGFCDDSRVRDISLNELYARRLIGEFTRRKIINNPHTVTASAQGVH